MSQHFTAERRGFLKTLGTGALLITVPVPAYSQTAEAGASTAVTSEGESTLNLFIEITEGGTVNLTVPTFEMGQGAFTGLAQILADELGADWNHVKVVTPGLDTRMNMPGHEEQAALGSYSVRKWYDTLRHSAATAREMLTAAAAQQWDVPPDECTVDDSIVTHTASGRSVPFSNLVASVSELDVPSGPSKEPKLRELGKFVGQSVPRVDIPSKVNGSAVFGADVRIDGMAYAAIRQSPVFGGRIERIDRSSVEDMPGFIDIVEMPSAVMVVAERFYQARKAVEALDVTFTSPTSFDADVATVHAAQVEHLNSGEFGIYIDEGDVMSGRLSDAADDGGRLISADYNVPFLHHAPIEPMTCTVSVKDGRCDVWVSTQDITTAARIAAEITGVPFDNVAVHAQLLGGAFGRKYEQDFVHQAVTAAAQVGRPVQLIWTREEDIQHGFYRPAMTGRMSATLEPDGSVRDMRFQLAGQSIIEHSIGIAVVDGADPISMRGINTETEGAPGLISQYAIDRLRVEYAHVPTTVPVGYWRAIGATQNYFFIESFIDELAVAAGTDPLEFRRMLLRDSPRSLAVLDRAASEAGWGGTLPEGHFQGVAFADNVGSLLAQIVEVSMVEGRPKVHRLVTAIDCGVAINPDSVEAQIQGAAIMALSATLNEQIKVEGGRVAQSNFYDYEVLKLADIPEIEVHIIESGAKHGGVGEAAVPGVAPAVANAVFAATGRRIRSQPIMAAFAA